MKSIVTTELDYHFGGSPAKKVNFLNPGQYLSIGEQLTSENGLFTLRVETDGNWVLRDWEKRVLWASGFYDFPRPAVKVVFGYRGAIYFEDKYGQLSGEMLGDQPNAGQLILQNNGNIVIYSKEHTNNEHEMLWQALNFNMDEWAGSKPLTALPTIPPLTRNALHAGDTRKFNDPMKFGDSMHPGDILVSENGYYYLVFDENGLHLKDGQGNSTPVAKRDMKSGGWIHMRQSGEFCMCEPVPTTDPSFNKDDPETWHREVWNAMDKGNIFDNVKPTPKSYVKLTNEGWINLYNSNHKGISFWSLSANELPPIDPNSPKVLLTTGSNGHIITESAGSPNGPDPVCGGVMKVSKVHGCGSVLSGMGACGAVYSGANFAPASFGGAGACGARASLLAVCGAVASTAGASVVSVTGVGTCGAALSVAGVCGAVLGGAAACGVVASGTNAAIFSITGVGTCGSVGEGAGSCLEASGVAGCAAHVEAIEGTGVCGLQVGFCGAVACIAFPIGGNW